MKKWSIIISRYLLGIAFLLNGLNMFFQFMPLPNAEQPEMAQNFLNILKSAGYFFPIMGIVKLFTAASMFSNKYLPLLLIIMFPITLNGVLFHIFMDPATAIGAVIAGALHIYLIYINRAAFLPMLTKGKLA